MNGAEPCLWAWQSAEAGRGRSLREWLHEGLRAGLWAGLRAGPGAPLRSTLPAGVPSAACTFRPAPAFRATIAEFHLRVASAAPEPAMSGPNGDLGMPVDAGTEGENDSFGEAGDLGRGGCC